MTRTANSIAATAKPARIKARNGQVGKVAIPFTPMNSAEFRSVIAQRIRRALPHVDADKVVVAPDCGLKYLPRDVAFGKMQSMAAGAAIGRAEHEA
jgi:5-methyltetrahydropteroyltriglutamate--homocysteine methyltransferase